MDKLFSPLTQVDLGQDLRKNVVLVYQKPMLYQPKHLLNFINVATRPQPKKGFWERLIDLLTGTIKIEHHYPGGITKWKRKSKRKMRKDFERWSKNRKRITSI